MAIDINPQDELKILSKLKTDREPLFQRMDRTFRFFRGDKFEIPKEEGVWENVTSNRAQSDGWKMINSLGAAQRQIFIEATKEDLKDREELNWNELMVNSLLFSAERLRDGLPENPLLQFEIAFYRVVRGWGAYRLLVMENDDGEPYLDLAVWDPRNVNYISGRTGLLKAYYERSVMKAQVEDEYGGSFNGRVDNNGLVQVVDVWDCTDRMTKEAVIAGGEYIKDPETVKVGGQTIDYLPIRIKAGGGIPLINESQTTASTTNEGQVNIKKVGEDFLVNIRELIDAESRLMTYHADAAGREAAQPTVLEWDSTKGDFPKEWDENMKDPRGKKNVVTIDVGKGQKVADLVPQALGSRVQIALSIIQAQENTGSLNPIAFGEGSASETAFGVDIRNRNTREHMSPFRIGMEGDYVWMAGEIVKQRKHGSFKDNQLFEGYDAKQQWVSKKIKIENIEDGKIFKCKLIPDELRDRAAHSRMALEEASMLPLRERLDIHQLSDDPDGSIEALWQEQADQMFNTPVINGFLAIIKDFSSKSDKFIRFKLENAFQKVLLSQIQNAQEIAQATGQGQQAGKQPGGQTNPADTTRKVQTSRRAQSNVPGGA